MATIIDRVRGQHAPPLQTSEVDVNYASREEAQGLFDRRARALLNMSGAEFLTRWDAGEFRPVQDDAEGRSVGQLVMMLPFARRTTS